MKRMALLLLVCVSAVLAGCQTGRPATAIRTDADFHYERGDYSSARSLYAEITERYPGDWRAQYRLGQCNLAMEHNADARRALEIAHTVQPDNQPIADALAEAMFRLGEQEQLFTFLRQQAEQTQSVHAYLRLARYAMNSGDPDLARTALRTAIALDDGESVEPYLAAARFAEQLGDPDLAIKRLRQAYGIDPDNEQVRKRLMALGEIPGPTLALRPGH